jgi:hypothetical protein
MGYNAVDGIRLWQRMKVVKKLHRTHMEISEKSKKIDNLYQKMGLPPRNKINVSSTIGIESESSEESSEEESITNLIIQNS